MWPKQMMGALPGHEHLTMADQMLAATKPQRPTTSPMTGAVENPRREFMKDRIQYRSNKATGAMAKDGFKY